MSKSIKTITAYFLILLGCLPWMSLLFFFMQQDRIREHMKEELEESMSFHSVVIADAEIVWVEKGKEILVNGTMFDIKSMESENGYTRFTGLYDHEETAIKKQLQRGLHRSNEANNQVLTYYLQLFQQVILNDEVMATTSNHLITKYSFQSEDITHRSKTILTPPPQYLFG